MAKILRVEGTADSYPLYFTNTEDDNWECDVEPDMSDGIYATVIRAYDSENRTATWSGWLYMCKGICHLDVNMNSLRFSSSIKNNRFKFNYITCTHK